MKRLKRQETGAGTLGSGGAEVLLCWRKRPAIAEVRRAQLVRLAEEDAARIGQASLELVKISARKEADEQVVGRRAAIGRGV